MVFMDYERLCLYFSGFIRIFFLELLGFFSPEYEKDTFFGLSNIEHENS